MERGKMKFNTVAKKLLNEWMEETDSGRCQLDALDSGVDNPHEHARRLRERRLESFSRLMVTLVGLNADMSADDDMMTGVTDAGFVFGVIFRNDEWTLHS